MPLSTRYPHYSLSLFLALFQLKRWLWAWNLDFTLPSFVSSSSFFSIRYRINCVAIVSFEQRHKMYYMFHLQCHIAYVARSKMPKCLVATLVWTYCMNLLCILCFINFRSVFLVNSVDLIVFSALSLALLFKKEFIYWMSERKRQRQREA